MSASKVQEFFDEVAQSKALQAKLKALHKKTEASMKEAAAALVKIASAAGFKFSAKDLTQARGAKGAKPSAAELAEVAAQSDCGYGVNYWCNAAWQCGYGTYH